MRKPGRIDLLFIGLLLIVSSIFSYFKGYIDVGIGYIMIIPGAYLTASGILEKSVKKKVKNERLPYQK